MNHGLRCDVGCTIDPARVLRVPDTLNFKSQPARPVKLLIMAPTDHDFETALAKLRGLAPAVTGAVTNTVLDLSRRSSARNQPRFSPVSRPAS